MSAACRAAFVAIALVCGCSCNAALPPVAPRCPPPRHGETLPSPPPESIASALLAASPSHMLFRADAEAAIVDAGGLVFVLRAGEARSTKDALTAALAPLPLDVRAATWDRTAVVVWIGRGHDEVADPAPRLAWDPDLRLDLVHDDLTDTGCLVRVVTPRDPRRARTPKDADHIAEHAARSETRLVAALAQLGSAWSTDALLQRRAHDWQLLASSGIWAERQRAMPIAAAIAIAALLLFYVLSLEKWGAVFEPPLAMLRRNGALVVPLPPQQGYRVLSYGLLHSGLNHLLNNCVALYIGAYLLEPALGAPRTLLVFFAGVVAAGVARRVWPRPGTMVGASGGTFALKGAALALALLPAAWVPVLARSEFLVLLGIMLAMGILFSFLPTVSLLAHLAGALAGVLVAACGVLTIGRPPLDSGVESSFAASVAWALAAIALAVWLGAGWWARRRIAATSDTDES